MHDAKKPELAGQSGQVEECDLSFFGAFPVIENLYAPDTYATDATFFAINGATVSVTLASHRYDTSATPPQIVSVVVGRLVMPLAGAKGLVGGLYDFLCKAGHPPIMSPSNPGEIQ